MVVVLVVRVLGWCSVVLSRDGCPKVLWSVGFGWVGRFVGGMLVVLVSFVVVVVDTVVVLVLVDLSRVGAAGPVVLVLGGLAKVGAAGLV